jgi:ParB/RepB/Spo0J family partition protein
MSEGTLVQVEIGMITADTEFNTRQKGLGDLTDLIESIKSVGIKEPLLGKTDPSGEGVEIYAGFRRLEAAKQAGLEFVPVIVVPRTNITKKQMLLFNIVENVHREDLNPVDEAAAYARLQQDHQMSTDDIASSLGVKKSRVERRFVLLKMADVVREAVHDGRISIASALEIDRLPKEKQGKFVEIAEELGGVKLKGMVTKELEKLQAKIEATEKAPKEPKSVDPADITDRIRRVNKASNSICNWLGYDIEKIDRVKAIDYHAVDPDDLGVFVELMEDLTSKVPADIDFNEKASDFLVTTVDSLGAKEALELNTESPVFRAWLTAAVGDHARELAVERSQGSGKRPKVTYAIAEEAAMNFFRKSE